MRRPLCLRTPLLSASCRIPTTPARLETLSPSNTLRPGQLGKLPLACLRRSPRARSSLLILSSASAACSHSPGSTATVLLKCQGRPGAHLSKSEQLPSCATPAWWPSGQAPWGRACQEQVCAERGGALTMALLQSLVLALSSPLLPRFWKNLCISGL